LSKGVIVYNKKIFFKHVKIRSTVEFLQFGTQIWDWAGVGLSDIPDYRTVPIMT